MSAIPDSTLAHCQQLVADLQRQLAEYQHGGRSLMNDDTSGTTSKTDPKTDWRRLRSMTDEEIHAAIIEDPDVKATDEGFWRRPAWSCRGGKKP
jgi:hypothetical protein